MLDLTFEGGGLPVVGEQLAQGPRIDHGSREGVAGDLLALLQDSDRELHAAGLGQPGKVTGPRQARRPGTHEEDIQFQGFALIAHACDLLIPSDLILIDRFKFGARMLPRRGAPFGPHFPGFPDIPLCYSPRVPYAEPSLDRQERFFLRRAPVERALRTFAEDVRAGLTARPKVLYPKYFYDELGSRLFEAITALPEYYPTRAEAEILRVYGGEIAESLAGPVRLVELGSGDGQKTRLLIEALLARQGGLEYLPVDISESAVEVSAKGLLAAYPALRVTAYVGEYQQALRAIQPGSPSSGRTLVLFLGSTLGNLDPKERPALLRDVRGLLTPGDAFLLGVDLKKSEDVLIPAYDDSLGVTAAFNLNLLGRINRELGGEFDLAAFRHRAVYNREAGRIEMHLVSRRAQTVAIRSLGIEASFEEGETIHTESSYKFDLDQVAALGRETGFSLRRTWTDSEGRFASNLLLAD